MSGAVLLLSRLVVRLRTDERGAALVEMTLVTPFLLLLCAGVFEFSNILYQRLLIDAGVGDAARYLARWEDTWSTCVTNAKNLAVYGVVSVAVTDLPRVSGWTISEVPDPAVSSYPAMDASSSELYLSTTGTVKVVTVTTSVPYSGTGLWSYLGFGTLNITASHQERVIGW
jgi:Flp pilus assembly protein TadG